MLQIRKLSTKTWKHVDTNDGAFILTKFYAKLESNEFLIVETYGAKRRKYLISEIEVYDIGGTAETFANFDDLFLRLEVLKYPAFYVDGEFTFNPSDYDLTEFTNEDANPFVRQNEVLSNDIADYTTASLPLSDTDKLLVNQGGTFKEVAKSDLVGNIEVENDLYRAWVSYSANNGGGFILDGTSNALTVSGTNAVVARGGTTIYNSLMMNNYVSGTGAGANAGVKNNNFADGYFLEGFDAYFIFANNDTNVNCQTNIGFYSLLAAIPNLATTDFTTNFVGIGNDVGDVNLSFYCKRTTATASYIKVPTNSSFPAHTTTYAYLLRMECNRTLVDADRIIKLTLTNIVTGATISHTFTGVENPTSSAAFAITANRSNRNTGVATNIRVSKIHVTRKNY